MNLQELIAEQQELIAWMKDEYQLKLEYMMRAGEEELNRMADGSIPTVVSFAERGEELNTLRIRIFDAVRTLNGLTYVAKEGN